MSRFEQLTQRLETVFSDFQNYFLIENETHFCLLDYEDEAFLLSGFDETLDEYTIEIDGQMTRIKGLSNDNLFLVQSKTIVGFLKIHGKKGLLDKRESHCDAILYNEKDFCFIELKLNASSLKDRAIMTNRKKAISQLENTLDKFDAILSKNYNGLNLEAYVSTIPTYPRNNTAFQALARVFLEKNGVPLFEENSKIFN
jgi:hypothetical protein